MTRQYTLDHPARGPRAGLSAALCALLLGAVATAQSREYTTDADFDEGILLNVNHDAPNNDQLQLGTEATPFPFISVANSGNGTMVRIDVQTGQILGEYRTAPEGEATDPSRATVDAFGNTWVGNRAEDVAGLVGSVVKIGLVIGGQRVDGSGNPDANGEYLKPPFEYSTAVDRDGDGLIRTSRGLGDIHRWINVTDGDGGAGGGPALVEDADDECILVYQKTNCPNIRHISIDSASDVWVGGYPGFPTCFDHLDGDDGSILSDGFLTFQACGGFSGLVDSAGLLWSVSQGEDQVMRYDPAVGLPLGCTSVMNDPRGIAIDSAGFLWVGGTGDLAELDATGAVLNTYPVTGAVFLHGVAVLPADDTIWAADALTGEVFRMRNDGTLLAQIPVGMQPNGLAVDAFGFMWVCNQGSDDIMRIDPTIDSVDMIVPLGAGSQPFNISDMTGTVAYESTLQDGYWQVTTDGGEAGVDWFNVKWNREPDPVGTIEVFARVSDDAAALEGLPWLPVTNDGGFSGTGRYIQTQARFEKDEILDQSPILLDLTVEGETGQVADCIRPNRRKPGSLLLFPEYDNRQGLVSIFTVTHVDCDAEEDLTIEFMYINEADCREFNRTEVLTPCDTLTLLTAAHSPEDDRGYAYVFVKDPRTGEPLARNVLIGSQMTISGLDTFDYGMNPVVFAGLGVGGLTDLDGDGVLDLDDQEYEMAPDSILVPRFLGQSDGAPGPRGQGGGNGAFNSELILIGLTGGVHFETTVDFLIYNDNEEIFSGEHTFYCWEKVPLLEISGIFGNEFLSEYTANDGEEILGAEGRESGWFRIDGAFATSPSVSIPNPAFYAVLVEHVGSYGVADLPFEYCSQDNGGLLPDDIDGN